MMILVNHDKLEELIEKAVTKAFTTRMTYTKNKNIETGLPEAIPKTITEDVFLPAFLAQYLPGMEGAFRGMQSQACKQDNKVDQLAGQVGAMGQILLDNADTFKALAAITGDLRQLSLSHVPDGFKKILTCGPGGEAIPKLVEEKINGESNS
jgi:hypothetical protein